jgi:hypothetical protein
VVIRKRKRLDPTSRQFIRAHDLSSSLHRSLSQIANLQGITPPVAIHINIDDDILRNPFLTQNPADATASGSALVAVGRCRIPEHRDRRMPIVA